MADLTYCPHQTLGPPSRAFGMDMYCFTTRGKCEVILEIPPVLSPAPLWAWDSSPVKPGRWKPPPHLAVMRIQGASPCHVLLTVCGAMQVLGNPPEFISANAETLPWGVRDTELPWTGLWCEFRDRALGSSPQKSTPPHPSPKDQVTQWPGGEPHLPPFRIPRAQ